MDNDFINIIDQYKSALSTEHTPTTLENTLTIILLILAAISITCIIIAWFSRHKKSTVITDITVFVALGSFIVMLVITIASASIRGANQQAYEDMLKTHNTEVCQQMPDDTTANKCINALNDLDKKKTVDGFLFHYENNNAPNITDTLMVTKTQSEKPAVQQCLKLTKQTYAYQCVKNVLDIP